MEKKNHLDQLPIANLTDAQLDQLKQAEKQINATGEDVYLIAFQRKSE